MREGISPLSDNYFLPRACLIFAVDSCASLITTTSVPRASALMRAESLLEQSANFKPWALNTLLTPMSLEPSFKHTALLDAHNASTSESDSFTIFELVLPAIGDSSIAIVFTENIA